MTDEPHADINRIIAFAKKKHLPAAVQAKIDRLVNNIHYAEWARATETLVIWAYEEGFRDGIADQKWRALHK